MNDEIVGVATFIAKDGKSEALCEALSALLAPTRQEASCLNYNLHKNLNNPNMFTMLERFKNKQAFDLHSSQPYLTNFRQLLPDLVDSNNISVELYKEID